MEVLESETSAPKRALNCGMSPQRGSRPDRQAASLEEHPDPADEDTTNKLYKSLLYKNHSASCSQISAQGCSFRSALSLGLQAARQTSHG
jgi:hypothetical protein